MKCSHCQGEVAESGFVYCPHCGKELKPSQGKVKRIFSWHLVIWPVLTWLIASGICYWLDKRDAAMQWAGMIRYYPEGSPYYRWKDVYEPTPGNPLEWAPLAWGLIAAVILYIVGCWIMYRHATRYTRNTVRWTTAAIVFTPILAWIAYGLSWRKS